MSCGYIFLPREQALFNDLGLVTPFLPKLPSGALEVDLGEYQGGTAVLGMYDTAFWVKDGVPYTVSGAARLAAPNMKQAPESIQYDDAFIAAAKREE